MSDPLTFILTFVLRITALVFLFRFMLQAVRASFYNPFSEGVVRITDPVLRPLRSVLPPYRNLDFASFAMAWIAHLLAVVLYVFAQDFPMNVLFLLNDSLRDTLDQVINIFLAAIFVSILMSWLAPGVYSPAAIIAREIAEPLLAPARRILPPMGGFDLSPMIAVLALFLIQFHVFDALLPNRL